jgi:hypothetical protein
VNVVIKITSLFIFLLIAFASCGFGMSDDGEGVSADDIIVPGDGLNEKLSWLRANAQSGGGYIIEISRDESVYQILLYFLNRINTTITIRGVDANRTIELLYRGNLFYVFAGVTLILEENITLKGYGENIYPLIYVAPSGVFRMNRGSIITGNISGVTGAVYVDGGNFIMNGGAIRGNSGGSICGSAVTVAGGSFIMNGGTISGNSGAVSGSGVGGTVTMLGGSFVMNGGTIRDNTARGGGAVMVNRGTFAMNGGAIRGNTAAGNGGAVVIGVDGAFTMNGGTISGNSAGVYGGGVSVGVNGNFCMNGGTISNNTAAAYGWGVFVSGTFTKNGGTISGYSGDAHNAVAVASSELGLAVYAYSNSGVRKRRETTAGPEVDLSYSGRDGEWSGEWDY